MIDKKVEEKIKNLFLNKKYEEVIKFSEKYTVPYKRPSSLSNLIGISKIVKKNISETEVQSALDLFEETYLNDKKGPHGLNGIIHLITILLQFSKKYENLSRYLSLTTKYYLESEKNFKQNENFLRSSFLLFKYLLNHKKLKEIIKYILTTNNKSKVLRTWCIIFNNYFYDWSQKDYYEQTKLNAQYFTKYNVSKIDFKEIDKNKKINIGFVSPDFDLNHSTIFFLKSVLKNINKEKFRVFIFSFAKKRADDLSQNELRKLADKWFDFENVDNQQAINLIQENKIKILVDLMGYTSPNRLEIFNSRVCPIQISWLAYCNTTGLDEVDYIISDKNLILDGEENYYSEKVLKLPEIWNTHFGFNYDRKYNELKNSNNSSFTFGSLNNFQKISKETIEVWSSILKKSEKYSLILKSSEFCDYTILMEQFRDQGVNHQIKILDRKNFKDKQDHLELYKEIDLALDTFPYNGVTTTFEALWMNVPVLVLKGFNFNSRCGESIIKNSGLDYFIAKDKNDYIEKALNLAENKDQLKTYRKKIYDNILSTPLFDSKKFTENFQNLLLSLS